MSKFNYNHDAEDFVQAVGVEPNEIIIKVQSQIPSDGQQPSRLVEFMANNLTKRELAVLFVAEKLAQEDADRMRQIKAALGDF